MKPALLKWIVCLLVLSFSLGIISRAEDDEGRTYTSQEHHLRFTVPKAWALRDKDFALGVNGSIVEFNKKDKLWGVLGISGAQNVIDVKEYAETFLKGMEKSSEDFKKLGESKMAGGGIRHDCCGTSEGTAIHYAIGFFVTNEKNYYFSIWTAESDWDEYKDTVSKVFDSLGFEQGQNQGFGQRKGKAYTNKEHNFKLTLPEGWTVKEINPPLESGGTLFLEFHKGDEIGGLCGFFDAGKETIETRIDSFMEGIKTTCKNFEVLDASNMSWGGIRRDCRGEKEDDTKIRWANVFIINNGKFYALGVYTAESNWEKYEKEINDLFNSISFKQDQKPVQEPGRTYTSQKHHFQFTIPKGWDLVEEDFLLGFKGTIVEFNKGDDLWGVLGVSNKAGVDNKKYADSFLDNAKNKLTDFKKIGKSQAMPCGGIRYDYSGASEDTDTHYAAGFFVRSGKNYYFNIWTAESDWDEHKNIISNIFDSLTLLEDK